MEVFTVAALAAIVGKAMSFLKFLTNKDWKSAGTLAGLMVIGVGVAYLATHSSAMSGVDVNGVLLGNFNDGDTILFGIGLGSVIAKLYDVTAGVDNSQSAAEPSLFPSATPSP